MLRAPSTMDNLFDAADIFAYVAAPVVACIATVAGVAYYRNLAIRRGIVAKIYFRTLHEKIVPRGGMRLRSQAPRSGWRPVPAAS